MACLAEYLDRFRAMRRDEVAAACDRLEPVEFVIQSLFTGLPPKDIIIGVAFVAARHVCRHLKHWFAFAFDPTVEPTIGKAEQAIRPTLFARCRVGTGPVYEPTSERKIL